MIPVAGYPLESIVLDPEYCSQLKKSDFFISKNAITPSKKITAEDIKSIA